MDRYEGLKRITSYDEAQEAKKRFGNYMKLYKWILETDSPYEDIKETLYKCIEKRKLYEEKEPSEAEEKESKVSKAEMIENEGEILSLKLQYEAIKSGTFAATLRRNIAALYISIGDWEARHQPVKIPIFKKKDEVIEEDERKKDPLYTSRSMRRLRFFLANITGLVPGEVDINMEARKGIPLYIIENYDLVNKPELSDEQKETALITVPQVEHSFDFYRRMFDFPVTQVISMYGIKEKTRDGNTLEISEGKTDEEIPTNNSDSKEVTNQPAVHESGSKDGKTNKGKDTNERTH